MKYDAVVVGGGAAGLTAVAYLARAGKSVALFEKQEKVGGLIQTFERNGVYFDGGLRSIENSGVVFPMLRQLGIQLEWKKSTTSIGIANDVIKIDKREHVEDYEEFLIRHFPENKEDVKAIIREVKKSITHMNVLYGIDNPAFMDLMKEKKYLFKTLLPWMGRFLLTIRKIQRLKEPIEKYLSRFTRNQALNDLIAQHFFKETPASFALSYFSLYIDYHYPKGGTASLVKGLEKYILENGGEIFTSTYVDSHNPEQKYILTDKGDKVSYDKMIWAADQKRLYSKIPLEDLQNGFLYQGHKVPCSVRKLVFLIRGLRHALQASQSL